MAKLPIVGLILAELANIVHPFQPLVVPTMLHRRGPSLSILRASPGSQSWYATSERQRVELGRGIPISMRALGPADEKKLGRAGLRSREIKLGGEGQGRMSLFVIEAAKTESMVEEWIENQMATIDPFGVVLWPAAQVISGQISSEVGGGVAGKRVLEVGCGTGLCSLAAASKGALSVLATDTNPQPLQMLSMAADMQGLEIDTCLLDIGCPKNDVPPHDVIVAADCMYNDRVAKELARLCHHSWSSGASLYVADSVNIARNSFIAELERLECSFQVEFLKIDFVGSAVGVDQDVSRSPEVAIFKFCAYE